VRLLRHTAGENTQEPPERPIKGIWEYAVGLSRLLQCSRSACDFHAMVKSLVPNSLGATQAIAVF